jgi:hypothetical protein
VSCIFKKVRRQPTEGTKVVSQRNSNRIPPCGATGRKIDLSGSCVRYPNNTVGGVKGLPVGDKCYTTSRSE